MWKTVCKNLNLNPKPQTYPNLMFSDQDKSQITAQGIGLTIIDQKVFPIYKFKKLLLSAMASFEFLTTKPLN
jgi:hypothetical protein